MSNDEQVHNPLFSQYSKPCFSYKQHSNNKGYVSSILSFKANSGYDYISDNCFFRTIVWRKGLFLQNVY